MNNLTNTQRSNLMSIFYEDLGYAKSLMEKIHETLPNKFTFLDLKRLDDLIDSFKDKDELYTKMIFADTSDWDTGLNLYYVYNGTIKHYNKETYDKVISYEVLNLINFIDFNFNRYKNKPIIKDALEDINKFKKARCRDSIESLKRNNEREKQLCDNKIKENNEKIKEYEKKLEELNNER